MWIGFGAGVGILLMIFQPPLGFLLAVGLPAWAFIVALRGRLEQRHTSSLPSAWEF
jgi:hypothetical protein